MKSVKRSLLLLLNLFNLNPLSVVLVGKKDGLIRFCIDYRRLNDVSRKDSYPLPLAILIFDAVAGSKWFATLDAANGYWQVEMDEADKEKTAFSIGEGLWEFNVMAYGLANGAATFQRVIELILKGLPSEVCLPYIDDIVVHARSFDEALNNLEAVFHRLNAAGLKLSPNKCHLFQKSVKYLGHLLVFVRKNPSN